MKHTDMQVFGALGDGGAAATGLTAAMARGTLRRGAN